MTWIAVIPVRIGVPRKTRLSGCLTPAERERLADRLFAHVANIVRTHPEIERTIILSPMPPEASPDLWRRDLGRGLNVELALLREGLRDCNLLVVHADLPLIDHMDLSELIRAAEKPGIAIASDHTGKGTNAVALRRGQSFSFAFGQGSLAAHQATARAHSASGAAVVVSRGLAQDVDCPQDLFAAGLI